MDPLATKNDACPIGLLFSIDLFTWRRWFMSMTQLRPSQPIGGGERAWERWQGYDQAWISLD